MTVYKTKPTKKRHLININQNSLPSFRSTLVFLMGFALGACFLQELPFSVLSSQSFFRNSSSENKEIRVCFSPDGHCTEQIVRAIQSATESVYVQAYSLTSSPIAQALNDAKNRGVKVSILLDKSQLTAKSSHLPFFLQNKVPVSIDSECAIAHNKIMIIDDLYVLTGSFNFTYAADVRNTENILFIKDRDLAHLYKENWDKRFRRSHLFTENFSL